MADDLSAPLGKKKTKTGFRLSPDNIPLARIAFGVIALIVLGVGGRILLVTDPNGGRPVADISVNSTHNANSVADNVKSAASQATITAGPEIPASGVVSMVGADVPDGNPDAPPPPGATNAQGLVPDLLEETGKGSIPRMSATGETPFEAYAQPGPTPADAAGKKLIAVVVTGLGLNQSGTSAAIDSLPGPVTLAFAPYGKTLVDTTGAARAAGHEILLEVPLEPFDYPDSDPGPQTLLTGQAPRDNLDKLFTSMSAFGGYVGLVNYMGARFTASAQDFGPVMEELGSRGLGYLDDGTSNRTVAPQLAAANNVEFGRADLTLDPDPARQPILDQLKALEARATEEGQAIGMISALPVSVQTLAEWAKTVGDRGFTLVPITALMQKAS
jgi:hypothetical protein